MDASTKQQELDAAAAVPPKPDAAPSVQRDQIDPNSDDAHSAAPSEGSGLTGNVEPPHHQQPSSDARRH
jgi:hypothetical protein